MIRRSLLTAALILVGSAVVAPKTMADTVDIPFSGTVNSFCTFGQITAGTLGTNTQTNPTVLYSQYSGGAPGKVSVTCNQAAKVAVSQPVQTGGPTFTPASVVGIVNSGSSSATSSGGSPLSLSANAATPLSVDMYATNNNALSPGTYNYKVTLTVTP